MIQAIVDGMIAALRTAFPEIERVYTEEVEMGFKKPCFVIRLINPAIKRFPGNRYRRTNLFSVQYYPESDLDAKAECYGVNDRLFLAMEYVEITDGLLRRGTNMHGNYIDGTLMFSVNYDMFIDSFPELYPMEELTIENQAK